MAQNNKGVITFSGSTTIASYASAVGKKEGEGPFAAYFDCVDTSE